MLKPTRIVSIGILGFLALAATAIYGDPAEDAREPTTAELLKRIDVLEARVVMLEERVIVPRLIRPQPRIPAGNTSAVPSDWEIRQFNGSYYYIQPLGGPLEKRGVTQ